MLKRTVLWWLVLAGLASLIWFTVWQLRPKGERLSSLIAAAPGFAVLETLRWIVRKVEPPVNSGNESEREGAPPGLAPQSS